MIQLLPDLNGTGYSFDTDMSRQANAMLLKTALVAAVHETVQNAATSTASPTWAQAQAGNYRKGKFNWKGILVAIETPKNAIRRGVGWEFRMKDHYGYLIGSRSQADGDPIDVFVSTEHLEADIVFVINQNKQDKSFDEHKAVIGVATAADAERIYRRNYPAEWSGFDSVVPMTVPQFAWWIKNADTARKLPQDFWMNGLTKVAEADPYECGCGAKIACDATVGVCAGCGRKYFDAAERRERFSSRPLAI